MITINKDLAKKIKDNKEKWAKEIQEYHYKSEKGLKNKYNSKQDKHFLQDIKFHLSYLAEAISLDSLSLFENYILWTKVLFVNLDLSLRGLENNLRYIKDILEKKSEEKEFVILNKYLNKGLKLLKKDTKKPSSHLQNSNPHYSLAKEYLDILLNGNRNDASELIIGAVENGVKIKDIYMDVFQPAQREIGRLWLLNKVSIAKEHYCTSVTQLIMSQLYSYILNVKKKDYTCITTCVGDELHELGIRMIADLLEMEGWDTIHLGANIPIDSIVDEIIEEDADLLAISVTMTSNINKAADLIKKVRKNDKTTNTKIMVGGYPFNINKELWKKINADGYAPDFNEALELANSLVNKKGDKNG